MLLCKLIDLLTRLNKFSREGKESFLHSENIEKVIIKYENNVNITIDWGKKLNEVIDDIMKDD